MVIDVLTVMGWANAGADKDKKSACQSGGGASNCDFGGEDVVSVCSISALASMTGSFASSSQISTSAVDNGGCVGGDGGGVSRDGGTVGSDGVAVAADSGCVVVNGGCVGDDGVCVGSDDGCVGGGVSSAGGCLAGDGIGCDGASD